MKWTVLISLIKVSMREHPEHAEDALETVISMLGENDSVQPLLLDARTYLWRRQFEPASIALEEAMYELHK